ncbi:hypothetical protein D3C85_1779220 [compost metagenome]
MHMSTGADGLRCHANDLAVATHSRAFCDVMQGHLVAGWNGAGTYRPKRVKQFTSGQVAPGNTDVVLCSQPDQRRHIIHGFGYNS